MQLADDLLTLLAAGATRDGVVDGPYPGLHYYRASEPVRYRKLPVFGPRLIVAAQGRKVAHFPSGELLYDAKHYLVVTGGTQMEGEVVEASPDKPYLALCIGLSPEDAGKALLAAGGADIILSTTNSAAQISAAFNGLRPNGRLINMGLPDGALTIDPLSLTFGQRQLRGTVQDERADLAEALQHLARGKVKPRIETYPLAKVNEVRERLAAGNVRYRAVLQHAA